MAAAAGSMKAADKSATKRSSSKVGLLLWMLLIFSEIQLTLSEFKGARPRLQILFLKIIPYRPTFTTFLGGD